MSSSINSEFSNINSESRPHNELTAEEMDAVIGGSPILNRETEVYKAFYCGIIEGFQEAGGTVRVSFRS